MPSIKRRAVLGASLAGLVPARRGLAQDTPVRIGVLNDQSGPYADLAGPGSALAVRMAAGDAGAAGLRRRVEVLTGDHQNKPDVGVGLIREWFAAGRVDCVVDVSNSAISLAAQPLAVQYDRLILHVSSTTSELAGHGCGARGVQWAQNTYADANGLARGLLGAGKTSYYFVTVDYAFGHAVEADMAAAVRAGGGTVTGGVRHPLNTGDFASFLASAQASGAQVVVLANSGADFITAVKQAGEFGITRRQALAAPIVYLTDVHALGLDAAQGLQFVQSWYWDMDEPSRTWAHRFFAERRRMPTDLQAGAYSAVSHFLRAVAAIGTAEAGPVLDAMRATPVEGFYAPGGRIAANNKLTFDLLLAQAKTPGESRYPWDYLQVLARIPGEDAFRNPAESGCSLVR
jgi:branched-chain amino acid transport system substrate-binding protein